MVLVDSSVWVAYFNGQITAETDYLHRILGTEPVAIGDLILTEVLQGFRRDSDYRKAKELLTSLTVYELLGERMAIKAADNYRQLRQRGITIRKTADVIIATYCIEHGLHLLYADRDFDPFVKRLKLRPALPRA
jgi:predicted nucleic acid-binding protein